MNKKKNTTSRRGFIRGAVLQGAAFSTIPFVAIPKQENPAPRKLATEARLPLKIMLKTGISDSLREKITRISPEIRFLENEVDIAEANVWFGRITPQEFERARQLQWVQSSSAGVEKYLFPGMEASEVMITNAKGCYAPAIAEHTMGLLFTLTRKLGSQTRNMSKGKWSGESNMVEMKGMTMGIIGLGGIGSQIARRARAMDMKVIAVDIVPKYQEQIGDICDEVRLVQEHLPWLLSNADVVVCAAPHTKESEGMLGSEQFSRMKKGAFFINVSRGKLVKTEALLEALKSGHLEGAGLDVTDPEPLPADHALWTQPNVIITSHISGRSQHSVNRMYMVFLENIDRFSKGLPMLNLVDKKLGF